MKYSKKIVIASISAVLAFWVVETVLIYFGFEGYSDKFVTCWFAFWGVELAALAGIKITETKYSEEEDAVG